MKKVTTGKVVQSFPKRRLSVVMFITLDKVPSNFSILLWMKSYNISIQMRTIRQYFPVMLFMILCKVVVTFESVNETIKYKLMRSYSLWYSQTP